MQQVSESVYVETEYTGCNTGFVVTDEGVVMIDTPQVPTDAVKWRDIIEGYGPVRYIINTEPHMDHITGNYFFEGPIIAHEGTREEIAAADAGPYLEHLRGNFPDIVPLMRDFYFRLPTITFSQRFTLHLGKQTLRLVNLHGHTDYELAVHIVEEGVVFASDNIFGRVQPGLQAALPYEWLDSLDRIGEMGAGVLVPGHGDVCGPDIIPEFRGFLSEWIDAVNDAIDRGLSLEETQVAVSFADRYPPEPNLPFPVEQVQRVNTGRLYTVLKERKKP